MKRGRAAIDGTRLNAGSWMQRKIAQPEVASIPADALTERHAGIMVILRRNDLAGADALARGFDVPTQTFHKDPRDVAARGRGRHRISLSKTIKIINMLTGAKAREMILVGGSLRKGDGAILDFDAREVSRPVDPKDSRIRIPVCDSSTFDRTAPVRICNVADLDCTVTDSTPLEAFREAAARVGRPSRRSTRPASGGAPPPAPPARFPAASGSGSGRRSMPRRRPGRALPAPRLRPWYNTPEPLAPDPRMRPRGIQ